MGNALWARRRQIWNADHDLVTMVELDIARAETTLRYWRVSIWLSLAMLLALVGLAADKAMSGLPVIWIPASGFALWAWWRCRHIGERLASMRRIRDELRME